MKHLTTSLLALLPLLGLAVAQKISKLFPGFGMAGTYLLRKEVATAIGTGDILMPASGSLTPACSNGRIRVHTAPKAGDPGINGATTAKVNKITGTDGTTTVLLYSGTEVASAAGVGIDKTYDFFCELALTIITVNYTVAGADCSHDVELAGNL